MPNRIKALRLARGWTQEQLAERLETTYQQVSRLENGERRLGNWIERLAKVFDMRPSEILDELSETSPSRPRKRELPKDPKEFRFLSAWRSLEDAEQDVFLAALEGMLRKPGERKNRTRRRG